MNRGECALTYNWGDSYKVSHAQDPPSQIIGLMKVAPTPGTDKIYSRKTKRLEPCNKENCGSGRGGIYYEDIGWVNRASYLAFGGWSAAVNNNIDPQQQKLILDFFSFMNGPEVSTDAAIPNASTAMQTSNGVDVFRASHLEVEKWVQKGFTRESVESYKAAVEETLNHPNAAYDMRFAGADRIFSTLEDEVYSYLEKAVLLDSLPDDEEERQKIRLEAANRMEQLFREIIVEEDSKAETLVPLLEQYQRDLGIYSKSNLALKTLCYPLPACIILSIFSFTQNHRLMTMITLPSRFQFQSSLQSWSERRF